MAVCIGSCIVGGDGQRKPGREKEGRMKSEGGGQSPILHVGGSSPLFPCFGVLCCRHGEFCAAKVMLDL